MSWFLVCVGLLLFAVLIGTMKDMRKQLDHQEKDIAWLENQLFSTDKMLNSMNDGLKYLFDQQTKAKKRMNATDLDLSNVDKKITDLDRMNESMRNLSLVLSNELERMAESVSELLLDFNNFEEQLREDRRRKEIEGRVVDKIVRPKVFVRDDARVSQQKHVVGRRRHAVFQLG